MIISQWLVVQVGELVDEEMGWGTPSRLDLAIVVDATPLARDKQKGVPYRDQCTLSARPDQWCVCSQHLPSKVAANRYSVR